MKPVVKPRVKRYASDAIEVRFEPRRCIHAAECVRRLTAVFDPGRVPWIEPAAAPAPAIADVIARCPTGALHFERSDGGPAEAPDAVNRVTPTRNGPLHLRGVIEVVDDDGTPVASDTRMALCRCGHTANPPFCDNSHHQVRFADAADVFEGGVHAGDPGDGRTLRVRVESAGPYRLEGPLEVRSGDGLVTLSGARAALCRCGESRNKPFCDGSHKRLPSE